MLDHRALNRMVLDPTGAVGCVFQQDTLTR